MRRWKMILAIAMLTPIMAVAGYVTWLWATYIEETVTSGAAYGFSIGASKQETLAATNRLADHPNAVVYVSYGPKAGDHFTTVPLPSNIRQLQQHDQWDVLLDGDGEFFNSVRLTFRNGELVVIHRHRQHFELP